MFGVAFVCSSCEKSDPQTKSDPIIIQLNTDEAKMAEANRDFAMDFFSMIYEESKGNPSKENILISPFSLSTTLAMVWNGAAGNTKTAIQNVLGVKNYTDEEVNSYYKKMNKALLTTDPSLTLSIANSVWYRKGGAINSQFVQNNKNWYDAKVQAVDFSSSDATNTINNWCSDKTNGLIKKVVTQTSPSDLLYLLNALYFKGEWAENVKFDKSKTQKGIFTCDNGTTVSANMMTNKQKLQYFEDETLSAVALPYGNESFSMVLVLPRVDASTSQMVAKLKQPLYWSEMQKSLSKYEVSLQVPRFKMTLEYKLNDVLKQMGMTIAFDPSMADFSRAFTSNYFCISYVKQFTYIDVNEKGTEAAAVTGTGIDGLPGDINKKAFIANRPFVFAIKEKSTGCILFMGLVGNPI